MILFRQCEFPRETLSFENTEEMIAFICEDLGTNEADIMIDEVHGHDFLAGMDNVCLVTGNGVPVGFCSFG